MRHIFVDPKMNFGEPLKPKVPGTPLPRTPINKSVMAPLLRTQDEGISARPRVLSVERDREKP
jgi:hypothetical protein